MKKESMNDRLKSLLFEILLNEEESQAEAWKQLKTMDLDCDDLETVIVQTPFADEAWELFKQKEPTKEAVMDVLKFPVKRPEVQAYLLEHFVLENEELNDLIEDTKDDDLARLLLRQEPDNDHLKTVMRYTNLKDEAARELLKRSPDNDELVDIIDESNLKMEAWERLLQQAPTNKDLIRIVDHTDLEDLAWERLLEQHPTNEDLLDFVKDYSETGRKKKEAAAILIERDLGIDELTDLIIYNQYADRALEKLKAKQPTCGDLETVFRNGESRASINHVAELSLSLNPDKEQLWQIFERSDKKAESALQLIRLPLELYELADLIIGTSIEPVLELVSQRVRFDRSQVNEGELIRKIAQKLIQNPELLNVNTWHDGDTHCLGGWAIMLNEKAQEIEKQVGPEIAAGLLLPTYTHLFFADKQTVLDELKKL